MDARAFKAEVLLRSGLVAGACLLAVALSGCGSLLYGHNILKAGKAIAQAEVNEAEQYAPYEYTYAVEHFKKAKEEVGYADYQAAVEYAKVATEWANKAKDIARKQKMEAGR